MGSEDKTNGRKFGVYAATWRLPIIVWQLLFFVGPLLFMIAMSGPISGPDKSDNEFAQVLRSIRIEK